MSADINSDRNADQITLSQTDGSAWVCLNWGWVNGEPNPAKVV